MVQRCRCSTWNIGVTTACYRRVGRDSWLGGADVPRGTSAVELPQHRRSTWNIGTLCPGCGTFQPKSVPNPGHPALFVTMFHVEHRDLPFVSLRCSTWNIARRAPLTPMFHVEHPRSRPRVFDVPRGTSGPFVPDAGRFGRSPSRMRDIQPCLSRCSTWNIAICRLLSFDVPRGTSADKGP